MDAYSLKRAVLVVGNRRLGSSLPVVPSKSITFGDHGAHIVYLEHHHRPETLKVTGEGDKIPCRVSDPRRLNAVHAETAELYELL